MAPDPTIAKVAKLVGLSKTAANKLQREAERRRVPSAQIVRKAIRAGIEQVSSPARDKASKGRAGAKPSKRLTPYQRALVAGLVGASRGLPADLSSNPKHMEGFGRD